jgi:flagellin
MDINTNIASLQGQVALQQTQSREQTSLQRLSTGLRINSAADDPSGLIEATDLKSDLATIVGQQTADGRLYYKAAYADSVLGIVSAVLLDAKTLTVKNANAVGVNQKVLDADQISMDQIINGIQRVGTTTSFFGEPLFKQQYYSQPSQEGVDTPSLDPSDLGHVYDATTGTSYSLADLKTGGALADGANTKIADEVVEQTIKDISTDRATLGDFQASLSAIGTVRDITKINLTDALSQVEDTDFAAETSEFVKDQILTQSGTAALAIANSQPSNALPLLAN